MGPFVCVVNCCLIFRARAWVWLELLQLNVISINKTCTADVSCCVWLCVRWIQPTKDMSYAMTAVKDNIWLRIITLLRYRKNSCTYLLQKFRLNKNYATSLRRSLKYFLLLAGDLFRSRNSAINAGGRGELIFNYTKSSSTWTTKFIGIISKQKFACEFLKKFLSITSLIATYRLMR